MKKRKQKHTYNHNFVENVIRLSHDKKGIGKFVDTLKKSQSYEDISLASQRLRQLGVPVDYLLFGSQWPKEIRDLGKCNECYFFTNSIESEISWLLYQIKTNKRQLNEYILSRLELERHILLGDYDKAERILEEVKENLGYSIWYFETEFLILYLQNRNEDVINLQSAVNEIKQDNKSGYVQLLLAYLAHRCRPELSAYDYDMQLDNWSKRNVTTFQQDRYKYLLLKLNYYRSYQYSDNPSALMMEGTNAIVDRYNLLQNIIKGRFVIQKEKRNLIAAEAVALYGLTADKSYYPYIAYLGIDMPSDYYDQKFIDILDAYYTGNYHKTCELCKEYIKNNPESFYAIKLYSRSQIFLRNGFQPLTSNPETLVNRIASLVYKIMIGRKQKDNLYKLYQLSKNLYGLSIASFVDEYIREEESNTPRVEMAVMSSSVFDPYFCKVLDSDEAKLSYLNRGLDAKLSSVVIPYQIQRIKKDVTSDERIVGYIRKVDNAKILFEKKEYNACIALMEEVLSENNSVMPIVQTSVKFIYDSYVKQKEFEDAIRFYVKWYIDNEASVQKIDTELLSKELKLKRYAGVRYTLDLTIFVLKNALRETEESFIVENYMRYKNVKTITELIECIRGEDIRKRETFLYLLYTESFFQHTIVVASSKEILESKEMILKELISLDSSNRKEYEQMREVLIQEMIIYDSIEKMDESKIYANIPAILKYEVEDAKRLYDQYVLQYKMCNSKTVVMLVDTSAGLENMEGQYILTTPVKYTDYALKEISIQLFESVCYPYLKSKFGLGSYLSARIRHGVLEGQIQSGLLSYALMLQKEDEEYLRNEYWKIQYGLSETTDNALHTELIRFSRAINSAVTEFKDNVLQIRLKDEEKGLFDYRLDDLKVCMYTRQAYESTNDFENFVSSLISLLQNETERCLCDIRREVQESFTRKIQGLLDELAQNAPNSHNVNFNEDFAKCITEAKRDMMLRLQKVESWFYIVDSKLEDFNLYDQIWAVWNITLKVFPSVNCELGQADNANELKSIILKGKFSIHFSDILRIFFTNMLKYSKKEMKRHFELSHSIDNNILYLRFENNFEGDASKTNRDFKQRLGSYERLQKEGGSGLVKAQKIVKYDLGCEANNVNIYVEENKCIAIVSINLNNLR